MGNTLTTLTSGFQDSVYTSLLDNGVDPGTAYEVSRDSSDLLEVDEYGDALETDSDGLGF